MNKLLKAESEFKSGNILNSIKHYEDYLLTNKDNEKALNNLAYAYFLIQDYENCKKNIFKSITVNKKNPYLYYNLGNLYKRINNLDLSLKYYDKAILLEPNNHDFLYNKGYVLLKQKKYNLAWDYLENRIYTHKYNYKLNNQIKNRLLISRKLDEIKNLVVVAEQGLGDEILFSSIYKDLIKLNINLKFISDSRLFLLLKRSFGDFEFIKKNNYDRINELILNKYQFIYSGSLGKYFRNKISDFDGESFLLEDKKKVEKYKSILSKYNFKKLVGISWKSTAKEVGEKSLDLNDLKDLFYEKDIGFINLQYGNNDDLKKFNLINKNKIIEIQNIDLFNDIDDVISLIYCLDLVITTPNVNVHFAGSIGKKCIVISPAYNELFLYSEVNKGKCEWYKNQTNLIINNNIKSVLNETIKHLKTI